jgi:hypothetical protein
MTVLFVLAIIPLTVAIVLARGEPVRTISCLGAMGVGCFIACSSLFGLLRSRT